jgi:hypothetical protein
MSDVLGRALGEKLAPVFGKSFVVENRALNSSVSALIAGDTAGTDVPLPAKLKVKTGSRRPRTLR